MDEVRYQCENEGCRKQCLFIYNAPGPINPDYTPEFCPWIDGKRAKWARVDL